MDKDVIQIDYETGVRAYLINGEMMFKTSLGVVPFDSIDPFNQGRDHFYSRWHALRAYQDEQRKKGVPIRIRGYDAADKWRDNHRKADVRPPFFFGSYAENPDLNEYSCDIPYIKHYASDGSDLGFFTNFRWREGYPKNL